MCQNHSPTKPTNVFNGICFETHVAPQPLGTVPYLPLRSITCATLMEGGAAAGPCMNSITILLSGSSTPEAVMWPDRSETLVNPTSATPQPHYRGMTFDF